MFFIDMFYWNSLQKSLKITQNNFQIHSGSSAKFAQELARITGSSFQSVGEVNSKLLLTPDMNDLINSAIE